MYCLLQHYTSTGQSDKVYLNPWNDLPLGRCQSRLYPDKFSAECSNKIIKISAAMSKLHHLFDVLTFLLAESLLLFENFIYLFIYFIYLLFSLCKDYITKQSRFNTLFTSDIRAKGQLKNLIKGIWFRSLDMFSIYYILILFLDTVRSIKERNGF